MAILIVISLKTNPSFYRLICWPCPSVHCISRFQSYIVILFEEIKGIHGFILLWILLLFNFAGTSAFRWNKSTSNTIMSEIRSPLCVAPCLRRNHDSGGQALRIVDSGVFGLGRRTTSDFWEPSICLKKGYYDCLMVWQGVADRRPWVVYPVVAKSLLKRHDQAACKTTHKWIRFDPALNLIECGSFRKRAFHCPNSGSGSSEPYAAPRNNPPAI